MSLTFFCLPYSRVDEVSWNCSVEICAAYAGLRTDQYAGRGIRDNTKCKWPADLFQVSLKTVYNNYCGECMDTVDAHVPFHSSVNLTGMLTRQCLVLTTALSAPITTGVLPLLSSETRCVPCEVNRLAHRWSTLLDHLPPRGREYLGSSSV